MLSDKEATEDGVRDVLDICDDIAPNKLLLERKYFSLFALDTNRLTNIVLHISERTDVL